MAKKKKKDITVEIFPTTGQISHLMDMWRREHKQMIVFTDSDNRAAEDIAEYLHAEGIPARYFHFEIEEGDRAVVLNKFKSRAAEVLVVGSGFERHSVRAPIVAILNAASSVRTVCGFFFITNAATERIIVYTDELTRELQVAFPSLRKESPQETKSVFIENAPGTATQDTEEKQPHIDVRDDTWTTGTYIVFRNTGRSNHGATRNIYSVLERGMKATPGGGGLGEVRWFERWKRYCFFPTFDTVYSEICLREIALFCDHVNKQISK